MEQQCLQGIINVLKPPGITSHDVINKLRRILGLKRIGHGGTLDPGAAGVLLTAVGKATRVLEFLTEENKTYLAMLRLGAATTTQDSFGTTVFRGEYSHLTDHDVHSTFEKFRGMVWQTPPMVSAIKHMGRKLYQLAREGVEIPREPRLIKIISLKIIQINFPIITFEVTCSKGTYVRTLCHDIGLTLGCGGHLYCLLRTSVGDFNLDSSFTLEEITSYYQTGNLLFLSPMTTALKKYQKISIPTILIEQLKNGRNIAVDLNYPCDGNKEIFVVSDKDNLIAIGHLNCSDGRVLFIPKKVFL
ncbi:MAG: tRNA pseudouridine(55) synthase TruB [Syntrophomonadaceae bacterium]|nr:tRNA pseudouridine(55) synthase TruB [Syntrophomonadaceae bacterium]